MSSSLDSLLTLIRRAKGICGDLTRFKLPLPTNLCVVIIVPTGELPFLSFPHQADLDVACPFRTIRSEELDHMIVDKRPRVRGGGLLSDHFGQICATLGARQLGIVRRKPPIFCK